MSAVFVHAINELQEGMPAMCRAKTGITTYRSEGVTCPRCRTLLLETTYGWAATHLRHLRAKAKGAK